jgi:hypothetical protein
MLFAIARISHAWLDMGCLTDNVKGALSDIISVRLATQTVNRAQLDQRVTLLHSLVMLVLVLTIMDASYAVDHLTSLQLVMNDAVYVRSGRTVHL